jgi:hypothetical protein
MKKETKSNEVPTPKVTKAKLVLSHLLKKKSITSLEAIELYSATRLSAIIFNLRQKKYDIVTKDVTIKDKYGNNCVFGKYILQGLPKK